MTFRNLWLAILAALFLGAAAPAFAEPALDKATVEAIVRSYILEHPEIIEDAALALQQKRADAEATRQKGKLDELGDSLVSAPQSVILGNPDGDITLIEFFDYNCGYCKRGLPDMVRLLETDPKLRVVLRDYPILGTPSVEAALVAGAVKQKLKADKYLDFHKQLLLSEGRVGKERALEVAKTVGLDPKKIEAATETQPIRKGVAENLQVGDALGITGTPTYLIGGEVVSGAVGYDALKGRIDSLRKCGKTACG